MIVSEGLLLVSAVCQWVGTVIAIAKIVPEFFHGTKIRSLLFFDRGGGVHDGTCAGRGVV